MSKTTFHGTTLGGAMLDAPVERQIRLYTVNNRIVIAIADSDGKIINTASLDLDTAAELFASGRDRVADVRDELEATQ